ncbi:uncharacterized protein LOC110889606 isoform X2 [Helianthus annuus]|uniref:uncharacterized protein LOC110889606 isoform X2 n=1 Tax=Helianthus annuus TaxID=4232 RepID=UPI001652E721|nr:uncharacterized protein LOC110889606 isoform X2 [Helianthus annuus]
MNRRTGTLQKVFKQEGSYLVLLLHWLLARNLFPSENPTGKVYGLGNDSDTCVHSREDPEIEKLNLVIKELVKEKDEEKDEEKETFNGIIAALLADKEKDKGDKDALLDRMSQIEAMLTTAVRR